MPPANSPGPVFLDKVYDVTLAAAGSFDTGAIIPAGFSAIEVIGVVRGTVVTTTENLCVRFNGDSGANYDDALIRDSGSDTAASGSSHGNTSYNGVAQIAGAGETANYFSSFQLLIPCYDNTAFFRSGLSVGGSAGSVSANDRAETGVFTWRSTAVINRLNFFGLSGNLAAGSRIAVYMRP